MNKTKQSPAKSKSHKENKEKKAPKQGQYSARRAKHVGEKRDIVGIIEESNEGRILDLVPIRHSRMLVTPFTYYRGAAAIMAADLSTEKNSGIVVQSCGDCHILNCGAFATPERNVIIDLNDFDETHPAPFEWDLKRLAASMVLAVGSAKGLSKLGQEAAFDLVRSYQREMVKYADSRLLDIWYSTIEYKSFIEHSIEKNRRKLLKKALTTEQRKSSPEVLEEKLVVKEKGKYRFKEIPPLLYHDPNLLTKSNVEKSFALYLRSLPVDMAVLISNFEIADYALKVVGTGSVGTFCAVVLLVGPQEDLLLLQVKEARQSVLEPYTQPSQFENNGQRIVVGQRIMQSASDMFLGWTTGEKGRHFYIRQLRDVKMSPNPELWTRRGLLDIATFAGRILAKAHAKSGEAVAISEYIGKSNKFAKEIAKYAIDYAEQTRDDYRAFADACASGRLPTAQ